MLVSLKKAWRCIMAGSKRQKGQIKQGGIPTKEIRTGGDPNSILGLHPSWSIASWDKDQKQAWSFYKERLIDDIWDIIFPKLQEFESMTWGEIFIKAKKQNHSNELDTLNKCAKDRLKQLHIEAESIRSLRLGGTLRIYGYLVGPVYNILWYDDNHGDNDTCVCRSTLKHT